MTGLLILMIFVALIVVTLMAVSAQNLAESVVYYMGFGLGSTVLYFLFSAPDVALTEAVIGAGISTAVFLVALLQTQTKEET